MAEQNKRDFSVTITVPITVRPHGYDGRRVFPSLHEWAAEFSGDSSVTKISRDYTQPFVFYLFGEEGPNGSFVATANFAPAIEAIVDQWPEVKETALAIAEGTVVPA